MIVFSFQKEDITIRFGCSPSSGVLLIYVLLNEKCQNLQLWGIQMPLHLAPLCINHGPGTKALSFQSVEPINRICKRLLLNQLSPTKTTEEDFKTSKETSYKCYSLAGKIGLMYYTYSQWHFCKDVIEWRPRPGEIKFIFDVCASTEAISSIMAKVEMAKYIHLQM